MQEFDFLRSLPAIAPEIGLTIMAIVVLALDLTLGESQRKYIAIVTGVGLLGTAALTVAFFGPTPETEGLYWGGMIRHDLLAQIFRVIVLIAGAFTALMSIDVKGIGRKGEFYLIVIVSTLGASLISASADLIMVFLALETTTIPLYILAAFRRDDSRSSESGMKYFLFGSFASALLLYGLSLLYGFTGQTSLVEIARYLGSPEFASNTIPVLGALVLIIVGFGFKISAAPFHFWTPDVYEGSPTPVTAFLSVASKAGSFALLTRFLLYVFPGGIVIGGQEIQAFWVQLAAALAVLSMTVGNLIALGQKNIKRLLAYSSIAQAGYTLIGVAALQAQAGAQELAVASIAFYMFMYTFTNLLAFAVIILFSEATGSENIADLAGLSRRSPWLALSMTIALLSLAGVPPAAGFFGKFFLFQAAVQADLVWLAMFGILNSLIALYYYLVVIKVMYVDRGQDEDKPIPVSRTYVWVLGLAAVIVILIGSVGVQPIFEWAAAGARSLLGGTL
ncbi:NADH-quinone oxidoreductase subunit N [Anaerolineae bacterium CFX9]|nr:NADH-quinone oxidoreductase subunit N [Geitlerinema splendidum]MDL1902227.1 NADH-quinone oxidoreductase subunit N [Anaerolineae bacterium CFX9]